ncbi:hypothetical protein CDAR_62771 [Caerostris darwini]|uniref:Uncharacterized protein n=1 Tax=Caerostris darwini TaxID=1538125 RepID=A0AAV4UF44_9ARAC|nr:hypothetical protein CDAR_62771 [Caerostris darwini]
MTDRPAGPTSSTPQKKWLQKDKILHVAQILSLLPVAQSLASAEGRSRVNTGGDSMAITARDLYAQQVAIDGHFPFPRSAAPPLCQGGHSISSFLLCRRQTDH